MLSWEEFVARKNAARDPLPVDTSGGLSEATVIHTCILRLALAVEDSRTYWARFDPSIPSPKRAKVAFEQRWFGTGPLPHRVLRASIQRIPQCLEGAVAVVCDGSSNLPSDL